MADHKHHHDQQGAEAGEQPVSQANGQSNGHAMPSDDGAPQESSADAQAEAPAVSDGSQELQALKERYLRLAAEFENYRKRVERERAEAWVRAQAQLAERLLEPLDDLQRIADFDPATTSSASLHEGAEMVEKKFLRALEAAGLEEIDAAGKPFDPTQHEALTTAPAASEEEDDTVAQVYRKGYRFKGVLVRPAQVVVKKHV